MFREQLRRSARMLGRSRASLMLGRSRASLMAPQFAEGLRRRPLAGKAKRTRAPWNQNDPSAAVLRTGLPFWRYSRTNPSARRYPNELCLWRQSRTTRGMRVPNEPEPCAIQTNPVSESKRTQAAWQRVLCPISGIAIQTNPRVASNGEGVSGWVINACALEPSDPTPSSRRCAAPVVVREAGVRRLALRRRCGLARGGGLSCWPLPKSNVTITRTELPN
jgi:hypothetical protein